MRDPKGPTKAVKVHRNRVKKASTTVAPRSGAAKFGRVLAAEGPADAASGDEAGRRRGLPANGDEMGVVVYIVLTVAIFALLGLAVKLVDGL